MSPLLSRIVRIAVAPAVLVAGGLALAQPALATDYCVQPNTTCGGVQLADLQTALNAAAALPDSDRIFLGAGNYTAPVSTGFLYQKPDGPLEIIGAGNTTSHIKGQAGGSSSVLRLMGGPGTSLHDLDVQLPANVVAGTIALWTNGLAKHVRVVDNAAIGNVDFRRGVALEGGTFEDSIVQMDTHGQTEGVSFQSPGSTVRNAAVNARIGIASYFGGTVDRTVIGAESYGVMATRNTTTIRSTLMYTYAAQAKGISAQATAGYQTAITADGVDIIGSDPGAVAVEASNGPASAANVPVTLKNSLIRNFAEALNSSSSGSGHVDIVASYSDYGAPNHTNGASASITEDHISNVGDVGFDPYEGYAPLPGSPLVDAGDPAEAQGLDLDGNPLVTDGDHDGLARRDIGAYELPGPLPGEGAVQPPALEQPSAPADQPSDQPSDQPILTPPGSSLDKDAPVVAGFTTAHRSFAIGRARTAVSARILRGTRFRYTLSEAARVVVKIQRVRTGKQVGKLIRSGNAGANSIKFSGRVGRKALKPGRYRAVITATDTAGNRSAPKSAGFRVVAS